ncbi:MFS transporter, YNFM family, putative membrane transport protein [Pseudonocardia thermophila]|jgi:Arabinose efflux permease|uniref:MFS transporter, YNFM family, putative membrane transport protein n=1 Tax=Pseudonocardia thermophila TaxID=1848 RepID=A0A1M6Q7K1_PSETH|nr:MFS transporter [Pseudonocardia thermophila]SHK16116.1 MFS transporter, YNFM family, putative membrane transport protein [Pseudonocardia thermophila]
MTTIVEGHERGSVGYRRLGIAMWCSGVAIYALIYAVQALLPAIAADFAVSPATASLAMSATTGAIALAIIPLSAVAERWGRTRTMTVATAVSAVLALVTPLAPTLGVLIALRALQGVTIAVLPALAVAHVTAEVAPRHLSGAVGMLIAGNTIGGLSGRLIAGTIADLSGWRLGLAAIGATALLCTIGFRLALPPQLAPDGGGGRLRELGAPLRRHLADPALMRLFLIGFLMMGTFATVFNYLGFRLIAPPFSLPASVAGLVFLAYLLGSWTSTAAGRLADRVGRRPVLCGAALIAVVGAVVSVPDVLAVMLLGLLVMTVGFFAAHTVASSWVSRRAVLLPDGRPAIASAQYLFGTYAGSSIVGTVGGLAYDAGAWPATAAYIAALLVATLVLALGVRPLPAAP